MPFPTRADWDSFFRENKEMNEMKAGERPDTVKLENMPCKWFVNYNDKSGLASDKPSEFVLKKAFSTFGEVRIVDIPMLDPYRHKMKKGVAGIKTFSFGQDLVFDAFIQFKEYIGFVKCMNAMKGMKLCYKDRDSEKAWTSNIKVDFDKTKHLAESSTKQRKAERERIINEERDKERQEQRQKELEEMQKNQQMKVMMAEEKEREVKNAAKDLVKSQRRAAREAKRKAKTMHKMGLTEEEEMSERIGTEERKLLLAQRKLESIRILDELVERVKATHKGKEDMKSLEKQMLKAHRKDVTSLIKGKKGSGNLKDKEREIREKLVMKLKRKAESGVASQEGRVSKVKTEELEAVSDGGLSEELEDVTEDEDVDGVSDSDSDNKSSEDSEEVSEIDSDEDLRLTSTDEEKEKKKAKKDKRKPRDDPERVRARKQRELRREILRAERIAAREKLAAERSPPRRREGRGDGWDPERYDGKRRGGRDYYDSRRRSTEREPGMMDDFERDEAERRKFLESSRRLKKVDRFLTQSGMRKEQVEKEMERAYEKYFSSLARKEGGPSRAQSQRPRSEQEIKEEQWERMNYPHLFGAEHGGGFRKIKPGQHYEEVQKEVLQTEIRIRERREQMKERTVPPRDHRRDHRERDYRDPRDDDYRYSRASSSRRERW